MEWVETTGRTLEEAKDAALDQLGVDEQDAEFEIVEEPRSGLFGRVRGEARVRARVRPTQPRPKAERRDRKKRPSGPREGREQGGRSRAPRAAKAGGAAAGGRASAGGVAVAGDGSGDEVPAAPRRRSRSGGGRGRQDHESRETRVRDDLEDADLGAQGEAVRTFLVDLVDAFGLDGEVITTEIDEETLEIAVTGDDLGLLIGPKGQTLQALHELSRSVVQRRFPDQVHGRIRVDVGGYRQRRKEALERFTQQIAEEVKQSGVQKALEPMSPPDRKVVHDTVNEIEGVSTTSEGEEPRRRVVILPG
jgi:spoIIIJ-associated protein